ncbi:MAG: hypothetical protein MUC53_00200 [Candidatus Contendobacter sp.]|jgi:hypothetical protein|nr:hypothetical protein [Candidatus Contendobacter sp.]
MSTDEFMIFLVGYLLAVADDDQPRTVYHDRIDGYLMPVCEKVERPWR